MALKTRRWTARGTSGLSSVSLSCTRSVATIWQAMASSGFSIGADEEEGEEAAGAVEMGVNPNGRGGTGATAEPKPPKLPPKPPPKLPAAVVDEKGADAKGPPRVVEVSWLPPPKARNASGRGGTGTAPDPKPLEPPKPPPNVQ